MKRILCLAVFFIVAMAAYPQSAVKDAKPPVSSSAPQIPVELQRDAFKAQSEYLQAESALEQTPQFKAMSEKRDALTTQAQKLNAICGAKYMLQFGKDGLPFCGDKPEPPKAAPTEKK